MPCPSDVERNDPCQIEVTTRADRSRLSILQVLCQGAKTVSQVSAATRLPQPDVSSQLGHLLECGCVTSRHTKNSVLYELSTPRLLQLEAVVDELLLASLKHRASQSSTEQSVQDHT
jgi:DNA-binding transcriptional ArsR family regulator